MKLIAELAARYPGVTIRKIGETPSVCHIDMNITNRTSVARLVRNATVSNIAPIVFTRPFLHSSEVDYADPLLLIYRFMTEEKTRPSDWRSAMEIFAINITHDMQEAGMMGSEEAEAIRDRISE